MIKLKEEKLDLVFYIILAISIFVIFFKCIVGIDYYMYYGVGSDTVNQYYPYFVNEVINIRNGSFSMWNWDYGLGTSIFNMDIWTTDPFGILIVLVGVVIGPQCIQYLLVWMQILKIVVMYFLGRKYIGYFVEDKFSKNLGAYLYAINGYIMLWGQHYAMGTACVYSILFLIAIENHIRNDDKKSRVYIALMTGATLLYSNYTGYMILFVSAAYYLFRYISLHKGESGTVKSIIATILAVLDGVLISAVLFITDSYYVLTNSARLDGASESLPQRIVSAVIDSFSWQDLPARLSRFLSNNLLYMEDNNRNGFFGNYYEAPQFFITVFIFFFAGQWLVSEIKETKKNKKWCHFIIKMLLLYILIFNQVSGLVLNAFAYPAYRYTFVIMPLLALMVGLVWQNIVKEKKISLAGIIIAVVLTAIGWLYSAVFSNYEVKMYVLVIGGVLFVGYVLIMIMYLGKKVSDMATIAFVVIVIASTVLDSAYTTQHRRVVNANEYDISWENKELTTDTAKAIKWLREYDDSFYRIVKTYQEDGARGESFLECYSSVDWYNSTPNKNVVEFYKNIYPSAILNEKVTLVRLDTDLDIVANELVNSKYYLSYEQMAGANLEYIGKVSSVYIYKNMKTESVAKWYTKSITKEDYEKLNDVDKAECLKNTVVTDKAVNYTSSKANVSKFVLTSQQELTGDVDVQNKGILMIAIPDQAGWSVYVDGQITEIVNCDYGFLGVELEAGSHRIVVKYETPYVKLGAICSIVGMILMLLYIKFSK